MATTPASHVDIVHDRIKFDREKIEDGSLAKIEVESFNLQDFWTQFDTTVQGLSNEVTKIGFMCGQEPYPRSCDLENMMANLLQYYNMMRDLYCVLPKETGQTLYKCVTLAVVDIMSSLQDFVISLNDLTENGASKRLSITGAVWEACKAVQTLPRNNTEASLKVIESEKSLASDALEELNTANAGGCRTRDIHFADPRVRPAPPTSDAKIVLEPWMRKRLADLDSLSSKQMHNRKWRLSRTDGTSVRISALRLRRILEEQPELIASSTPKPNLTNPQEIVAKSIKQSRFCGQETDRFQEKQAISATAPNRNPLARLCQKTDQNKMMHSTIPSSFQKQDDIDSEKNFPCLKSFAPSGDAIYSGDNFSNLKPFASSSNATAYGENFLDLDTDGMVDSDEDFPDLVGSSFSGDSINSVGILSTLKPFTPTCNAKFSDSCGEVVNSDQKLSSSKTNEMIDSDVYFRNLVTCDPSSNVVGTDESCSNLKSSTAGGNAKLGEAIDSDENFSDSEPSASSAAAGTGESSSDLIVGEIIDSDENFSDLDKSNPQSNTQPEKQQGKPRRLNKYSCHRIFREDGTFYRIRRLKKEFRKKCYTYNYKFW